MSSSTLPHAPRHFDYIDAVRGIAFLGVLLVHSAEACGKSDSSLFMQGAYGVQLFFLASAITLCNSMASRHEANREGCLKFYLRRIFRIAPLFWLSMVFYWSVPDVIPRIWLTQWAPEGIHPSYFVLTAFFIHGWHPYTFNSIVPGGWSIAVEMTFYLLFPLCFYYITNLRKAVLWILAAIILLRLDVHFFWPFSRWAWPDVQDPMALSFFHDRWFPYQFPVFLIGIFTYFLMKVPEFSKISRSRFWSCCLFLFCAMILLSIWHHGSSGFVPDHLVVTLAMAGIIFSLAGNAIPYAVNPLICHLGKLSYSCYLTHFAALGIVLRILTAVLHNHITLQKPGVITLITPGTLANFGLFVLTIVATLILTVLFSSLTYRFVELPGISLGKWIIRRISNRHKMPFSSTNLL